MCHGRIHMGINFTNDSRGFLVQSGAFSPSSLIWQLLIAHSLHPSVYPPTSVVDGETRKSFYFHTSYTVCVALHGVHPEEYRLRCVSSVHTPGIQISKSTGFTMFLVMQTENQTNWLDEFSKTQCPPSPNSSRLTDAFTQANSTR